MIEANQEFRKIRALFDELRRRAIVARSIIVREGLVREHVNECLLQTGFKVGLRPAHDKVFWTASEGDVKCRLSIVWK